MDKVVELVGEGSVNNGATPSSFHERHLFFPYLTYSLKSQIAIKKIAKMCRVKMVDR